MATWIKAQNGNLLNIENAHSIDVIKDASGPNLYFVVVTFGALFLHPDKGHNDQWNSATVFSGSRKECDEVLGKLAKQIKPISLP